MGKKMDYGLTEWQLCKTSQIFFFFTDYEYFLYEIASDLEKFLLHRFPFRILGERF